MIRGMHRREYVAIHLFLVWAMVTFLVPLRAIGADEDLETIVPLPQEEPVVVGEGMFYYWVFGSDANSALKALDDQINKEIRAKRNLLTDAQVEKLIFAASVDKQRHLKEIEELRIAFDDPGTRVLEVERIAAQAKKLHARHITLLGPNSLYLKMYAKILADTKPDHVLSAHQARHQANLQSAIRPIERAVTLSETQKRDLINWLQSTIPVTLTETGFEDVLVKYQIAKLASAQLHSRFEENQWPRVQIVLDEFLAFGDQLRSHGLVDEVGQVIGSPVPNVQQSTSASNQAQAEKTKQNKSTNNRSTSPATTTSAKPGQEVIR